MNEEISAGRRLVVGYDASSGSESALSWAIEHAGADDRIIVVNGAKSQPDRLHVSAPGSGELARRARAKATLELAFLERSDVYESADASPRSAMRLLPQR
jgi:nucleotide-binding universal stress UspA family protein